MAGEKTPRHKRDRLWYATKADKIRQDVHGYKQVTRRLANLEEGESIVRESKQNKKEDK